ncbi:nuclear transport factor 2 family protein [Mycolicibacterium sp. 141076]|uniref:nuclear transport factor 2 family protein n=1 Tax=Mycobacteriaceae TaxID=1762 RepID=UPI00299D4FF6|nr:nuclear transport factor 2 family protein [Mycolicibacterium sp. 141076]MDX1881514.1 nuclear transport factor 2 family protein [Mycolicibacterium sp. 141076]
MNNDTGTGWAVAGAFLEAFAGQDFTALAECLDPDVHFRALIPPGLVDVTGAGDTVGRFRHWFGAGTFELVDASVGRVGDRIALSWRVLTSPPGDPTAVKIVEQRMFAAADDRIHSIDLLCSGFQSESKENRS